jgi:ribose 5-phosphate isomerase B
MNQEPLFIASDHAGYTLKQTISSFIEEKLDRTIIDLGPMQHDKKDDYPDYAIPLAKKVAETEGRGILLCGNGVGVCMAANKINGIRAGIGYSRWAAETMRTDDNTNILCLPARALNKEQAKNIVNTWLKTDFSQAQRHQRRLNKINKIE